MGQASMHYFKILTLIHLLPGLLSQYVSELLGDVRTGGEVGMDLGLTV